jgi:hypothetical protein
VTYGSARLRYERRKRRRQRQLANAGFWNVLTIIFSIGTILLGAWFFWTLFPQRADEKSLSNNTPIPNLTEQGKSTPSIPSSTPTKLGLALTLTIIPTTNSSLAPEEQNDFTFDLQAAPQLISATLFRSDRKCNWMGVAGQAFDLQGRPVPGITVQVTGPLYGKEIRFLSLTGAAPWYGAGGYEVFLSDKPFDSKDKFLVRLVDQNGKPLSPRIPFSTSSECEKNQVIVNFRQIK